MTEHSPLQLFFFKHINAIKRERILCGECGERLKGDFSEVAHILPKSKFKSIATNDDNVIYLCGWQSNNNCHGKLDNSSIEDVKQMKIYPQLQHAFELLENEIKEKISWKTYERFEG